MNEREQIINFLLQNCDGKQRIIEELQKRVAELEKQLVEYQPQDKENGQVCTNFISRRRCSY